MSEIADLIRRLSKKGKVQVTNATVKEVQWSKRTMTVETEDGREFTDVRLRAVADEKTKGMCIKPKIKSSVLIGLIDDLELSACMVMASEIDAIEIVTDSDVLKIDVANGSFEFNGGGNDGMVKIKPLVQQLNRIENYAKNLATAFNSHTHPVTGASTAAPASPYANSLTNTQQSDIENEKIKH